MPTTALIIGLGSMGKRRIRLLRQIDAQIQIAGVDSRPERITETMELFGIQAFYSIQDAISAIKPSIAFVCTAPLAHRPIILELLHNDLHVFTEINLVRDGYEMMSALAKQKKLQLFLSSTFLYRNDVRYMIERVQGQTVNYQIHIGQYLPDWHPWENYLDFFVGDKRTNGCREIMAIDFPWILSAFGPVKSFHVLKDKSSTLQIDYDDNYIITFAHENGCKGVVLCDLITRKSGRHATIFSESCHITWDGTPDSLFEYSIEEKCNQKIETYMEAIDQRKQYNPNIIENAYREEIISFFDAIAGIREPLYSFEQDLITLDLIDRIEGSV